MDEKQSKQPLEQQQEQEPLLSYEIFEGPEATRKMLEDFYAQNPNIPRPAWLDTLEQKPNG